MASPAKEIVYTRIPQALRDEVRRIAQRDGECESTVIRRLLRTALDVERRSVVGAA